MDVQELVRLQYRAIITGDADLARRSVAADFVNEEAGAEPPACSLRGPAGLLATGAWLRFAISDLEIDEHVSLADEHHALSVVTFRGRHTGPFTVFEHGKLTQVVPPSGRPVAVPQVHVFRVRDGELVGHSAVRNDLAMLTQMGTFPPTPAAGVRMLAWRISGRAARAGREVVRAAEQAAARAGTVVGAPR